MAEAVDRAIAALAARQRGYVTRGQLLDLGLGRQAISYRLKLRRLVPVYTGVYAVGHLPRSPVDGAAGAVLACGPGAVLSHGSAAALWGFARRWTRPFEVTARSARCRAGIRVHRSAALARQDQCVHLGVRVTSPARTVLDIAPSLNDRALKRAVSDALLSNYLRPGDLAELLGRCRRHPGAARLAPIVAAHAGPTRSQFEDEFLSFIDRFDLPYPKVNVRVCGYEVDALFERERVIVELDGFRYHAGKSSFERDRERDADTLAAGYETVRITWGRLTGAPHKEARRLDAILRGRRG